MPNGSSRWNGKYGATETKRRGTYGTDPQGSYELGKVIEAGEKKKPEAPDWSKYIKDIPKDD